MKCGKILKFLPNWHVLTRNILSRLFQWNDFFAENNEKNNGKTQWKKIEKNRMKKKNDKKKEWKNNEKKEWKKERKKNNEKKESGKK